MCGLLTNAARGVTTVFGGSILCDIAEYAVSPMRSSSKIERQDPVYFTSMHSGLT